MIINGTLEILDFLSLLNFLSINRRSGILLISSNHQEGVVYFDKGEIIDVGYNKKRGEEAFYMILESKDVLSFYFITTELSSKERTIYKRTEELILEALRREDEKVLIR
ncbi:MAG: DUF4388 domain-containing protein [Dictyoglomus sp.]|nr:DUF4388 domain-containing protein [Dictyoglomus sp.]MCX7942148.1 DUF4388 domain-containing protein [Dictyoglomaceae bacterium]MDW8188507.1 DUF4388 domain-containing protein [Dictyoglomus sp.]